MSIVEQTRTHTLELSIAHLNGLARVITGAYQATLDSFGSIRIQGDAASSLSEAPWALGLTRTPRLDHVNNGHAFRIWTGQTTSAFGSFKTTIILVEDATGGPVADCDSVEG